MHVILQKLVCDHQFLLLVSQDSQCVFFFISTKERLKALAESSDHEPLTSLGLLKGIARCLGDDRLLRNPKWCFAMLFGIIYRLMHLKEWEVANMMLEEGLRMVERLKDRLQQINYKEQLLKMKQIVEQEMKAMKGYNIQPLTPMIAFPLILQLYDEPTFESLLKQIRESEKNIN